MKTDQLSEFEKTLYEGPQMIHGGRIQPVFLQDGVSFCFHSNESGRKVIYKVDSRQNTRTPLLETEQLLEKLKGPLGHDFPGVSVPFEQFEFIENDTAIRFVVEGKVFALRLDDYHLSQEQDPHIPSEEELQWMTPRVFPWIVGESLTEELTPNGKWFLGLQDHNIYLRSIDDGKITFLTDGGTEEFMWDTFGAKWSLDGSMLAVKKVDLHEMTRVPIVHWLKPLEEVETMRWARPGQPLWKNELHIINIQTGEKKKLDTGPWTDPYLNIVGWLPGELVFARADRECKTLRLMAANPLTGKFRTILTETQPNFHNYEVLGPLPVTPLSDGQHFLWTSERDGWSHLYLYHIDGTLVRKLTEGEFSVFKVVTVDKKEGWVYFLAMGVDHPYDIRLHRVRLDGSGFSCLTDVSGSRDVVFTPSMEFFLDFHSDIDRPLRTDLRKADGTFLQTLEKADTSELTEALHYSAPEEFWVKALDGETLERGLLYKPYDFDPAMKYPVIEYIYGGPHTLDVPISYFGFPLLEAVAQAGFIVYVVDCRGTIGRGKKFQDVCYGRLGLFEIPEHVCVLKQLAGERPYMDISRVGIFGLSHGGFMSLRAILTAPETYHVAVATCPPYGTTDMAWLYTERFNNIPQNNLENYQASNCLNIAGNLQGKLMISHGTIDHNAPIAGTIKMIDALVRAGKHYDLLLLPEQYHLYSGESQKYWEKALVQYFLEHLYPKSL
jgi:dipeptidyl aminopeptidase/acylaminoacyl peptidase